MRALRMVVGAAMIAVGAACAGEIVNTPAGGRAVIAARSSELSVGDTMTLNPGVQYNDGRYVPLDSARLSLIDTTFAALDPGTRVLRGKRPGIATVRLDIQRVGSITRDFNILP